MRNFKKSTGIAKILNKGPEEVEKHLGKNILHLPPDSWHRAPKTHNFLSGRTLETFFCSNILSLTLVPDRVRKSLRISQVTRVSFILIRRFWVSSQSPKRPSYHQMLGTFCPTPILRRGEGAGNGVHGSIMNYMRKPPKKSQKYGVWRASKLVNTWRLGRVTFREGVEALCPFPTPDTMHLFHVAVPELYPCIINW